MRYISTRGLALSESFSDVLLLGLATDGGLVMPAHYPHIDTATLERWRDLSYPELAFEIIRLFADDIPAEDLRYLVNATYTPAAFGSEAITPLSTLNDGLHILGLSHGPTLAFKDIAMQFLGHAFEYVLSKQKKVLNIVGATSGDTGSAAEYALRGKAGIRVFMLSPHGKMSAFQRAQMYSLQDNNIHNIALEGLFDDCQDIVKALQEDSTFKQRYHIGTVNSINFGRVVAQIVYYFKGYFAATRSNDEEVSFCVPSGNFGNICAGHMARQMGLPIRRLIVATNENDVLDEFFKTGLYRPRDAAHTFITSSPSMDIAKASNFERFVFDLLDRDGEAVAALWAEIARGRYFNLSYLLPVIRERYGFYSGTSNHQKRLDTIQAVHREDKLILDPHTADGVAVARRLREAGETLICLETALAAKFDATIAEALGRDVAPPRPAALADLENRPQRVTVLPNNALVVKQWIKEVLDKNAVVED